MSCDYRIQGEATIRNIPEVRDAIEQLASVVRGEDYLEVTQDDSNTLELSLNYDNITTIHTPAHFGDFLNAMTPAVIGCGVFEIETSGEVWTEWIGEERAIKASKSNAALISIKREISDLLPEDLARCLGYIRERKGSGQPL